MVEVGFQKLTGFRLIEPGFDGQSELEKMFGIIRFKPRIPPSSTLQSRATDALDEKMVGFLKGEKVFLTGDEIEEHILY